LDEYLTIWLNINEPELDVKQKMQQARGGKTITFDGRAIADRLRVLQSMGELYNFFAGGLSSVWRGGLTCATITSL
jgi:hypothetical protein